VWRALATILHGAAMTGSGRPEAGISEVEEGFSIYSELQTPPVFWPQLMTIRARAYGMAGQIDRALEFMDDADASRAPGDPLAAEMALARGDLLLAREEPDVGGAEALFERALSIGSPRGARMEELEALTRLVKVRADRDGAADLRSRLRSVYDTFTEGFDTAQLRAARAVLGID
jgi:hypothetical protein